MIESRQAVGLWLLVLRIFCVAVILLTGGCAVNDGGEVAAVKIDQAEARIVGIQKEIQKNTYQRLEAQGSIATYAGLSSVGVVFLWCVESIENCFLAWLGRKRNGA